MKRGSKPPENALLVRSEAVSAVGRRSFCDSPRWKPSDQAILRVLHAPTFATRTREHPTIEPSWISLHGQMLGGWDWMISNRSWLRPTLSTLARSTGKPTVKQHLAAIRMCLDWLVVGPSRTDEPFVVSSWPQACCQERKKTPVLTAEEARQLLDSIDISTPVGLRDERLSRLCYSPLPESVPSLV